MRQRLRPAGMSRVVWAAVLICLAAMRAVDAQDPSSSSPPLADSKPAEAATFDQVLPGEVLPKIFLLKDKDGNLQPMPGMRFEDFMEAWKQKQLLAQPNRMPAYSIEEVTLRGTVTGGRAELVAQFNVSVLESGWVGVPLRLNDAVIRTPQFEGPGQHVLDYDPARDGYRVWIKAEPGKSHQVNLKLLANVGQVGPESSLRLNLPRAVVATLQLRVPAERAVAKVSDGCTLESSRALEGGSTELNVAGLGGQCEIGWHAAEAAVAAVPTVLEASGLVNVRVNGRTIHSEAKLTVRSLGGEFDRFQVRLPPGADYVGTAPNGLSLVAVENSAGRGKTYEVRLNKKTAGPVEVPLATERVYNNAQGDSAIELAGFEVLGAVRQSGSVAIKVEGNWQLIWADTNQAAAVDDLESVFRRTDLTAGFEYFAQPYSLSARIVPQKTRIRVQPEYVLSVGGEEAQLVARLKYTIRGAKVRSLEVDLPGWDVDVVGPASLVNVDAISSMQNDPLSIPLLQAASGEIELTIEAHRKLGDDKADLTFHFPRPRAETVSPATVAVVPADNVELTMIPDHTLGLAPQTSRPPIPLPERLQDPLHFRTEGDTATLGCALKIHEQSITVSVNSQLEVDELKTQVNERIAFQVAYEPADYLTLGVPKALRAEKLTITLDGQRLMSAAPRDRSAETGDVLPVRLPLPVPRIGRCELVVSYVVPHEKLASQAHTKVTVPLVMPAEGQLTASDVSIAPQAGVLVNYPNDGNWSQEPRSDAASDPGPLVLSARRALPQVALALSSRKQPLENAPTVERAWIQTRLSDNRRQDHAVFRFRTSEPRIQVLVPAGVDMGLLELQLDTRRVAPEAVSGREMTLSLTGVPRGEHVLELDYPFAERPAPGVLALQAPQIKGANWVQQVYWQLLVPTDEHLLFSSDHYTREFRWTWDTLCWVRRPTWESSDLEAWSGVTASTDPARPADPPESGAQRKPVQAGAANSYLFSSVGAAEPLQVRTIARARLVLWASLPLLLVGLVLIYFPLARHPAWLFVVAATVFGASLLDAELALLIAQASTLGIGLAVLAAVLARSSLQPDFTPVPVRGSSQALVERGTTEIYHRPPVASAPASTASDQLLPTSMPEGDT